MSIQTQRHTDSQRVSPRIANLRLRRLAKAWADQGWPAELDENGSGITAPFNAPSQGPPPWNVYRINLHSLTVVLGTEPGGLTRFRF
jgi:hypothetical protein